MLNRSLNSVMARLGIVAAALALLALVAPVAFAATTISYPENGTEPVATFSAMDQDGDPIVWSLAEKDDYKRFTIDGGELAFVKSPNYESPNSAVTGGTLVERNVYKVTVQATGGTHDVVVTVTNVDEPGKVTFSGEGRFQPQIDRGLDANLTDPEGQSDAKWQWSRSADMETWTDIMGATSQNRSPVTADEGMYLRASVEYTDSYGSGKTASAVTGNVVEERTVSNAAPSFKGQDEDKDDVVIQVSRKVGENSASGSSIGKPVSASDANNDVLVYTLGGDDAARFDITNSTGQLKVKQALNFEGSAGAESTDNCAGDVDNNINTCEVTVTATDPSGASADQPVTITITNANEGPMFDRDRRDEAPGVQAPRTTLWVTENDGDTTPDLATDDNQLRIAKAVGDGTENSLPAVEYAAMDEDTVPATATGSIMYALEGADKDKFGITSDGVLTVGGADEHDPNYEKQSSYSITIVVSSGTGTDLRRSRLNVTVNVVDAEDGGSVSLSQREPQIDRDVVATLTDDDGGVVVSKWQWERSADGGDVDNPTAALCSDADLVWDADGGEVITDASSAAYTPSAADENRCLRATVTYTDNIAGDGADLVDNDGEPDNDNMDGVAVAEVSERAVQESDPANTAPRFPDQDLNASGDQSDSVSRTVAENTKDGVNIGAPVDATDTDLLLYTLGGADAASFGIAKKTGQIKTKAKLDYEALPDDAKYYMVMVTATDPSGANDSIMVTINVTDEQDDAVITGEMTVSYPENGMDPVATFSAMDQDGDAIVWSLAEKDDYKRFTIDGGELAFVKSPNYESPNSAVTGGTLVERSVYKVTVQATGGTHDVVVTVTNVDEDGKVTFINEGRFQPQVGRGLEATLTDPEGQSDAKWQWSRSADMETWADIMGSTSQNRSPVAADEGMYLRASVTYTDSYGSGKTASAMTDNMVEERTLANAAPSFKGQDEDKDDVVIQVSRKVGENSASGSSIGKPVSASDANNDVLVYTLGGDDAARFDITNSTGQLKVKQALNFEAAASTADAPTDNCTEKNACEVTVTATDPSGASAGQPVTITITNANEGPMFDRDTTSGDAAAGVQAPRTTLWVTENDGDTTPDVADDNQLRIAKAVGDGTENSLPAVEYLATDEDAIPTPATAFGSIEYDLEGADKDKFGITSDVAVLTVGGADEHDPNYEKQSSYSITIVVSSGTGTDLRRTRLDVTVNVVDAEDEGMVSLSQREPQIGRDVIATLTDADGGVVVSEWKWERSEDLADNVLICTGALGWGDITDASSAAYTPTDDDDGACLRATVTYTDNIAGDGADLVDNDGEPGNDNMDGVAVAEVSERAVQESAPANTAPRFPDQDLNASGDQSDSTSRTVAENTKDGVNIGAPVDATDTDLLLYTLGGADAASFGIAKNTGQLKTKAKLDYETKNEYMAVVTATDPSGAIDSIMVTIMVIDGPDDATITLANNAPAFEDATPEFMVDENMPVGTDVGMVMATDADDDTLTYSVDSMYFDIDDMGQITTAMSLDHEAMSSHTVTVTADDGQDEDNTATITVTIMVTDVPEGACAGGAAVADMTNSDLLADCDALLDSEDALGGTLNWDVETPIADWDGVRVEGGRVTRVVLIGMGLDGTIPAELAGLTALEYLQLNDNALTGGIPAELGSISSLVVLYLQDNMLSGGIPTELGDLSSLKRLYLMRNDLSGGIPTELGNLGELEYLYLYSNELTGEIPSELSDLARLIRLHVHDNMLTGGIPAGLGDITRLRYLLLHGNQLTGEIPSDLGNASNMKALYLYNNMLTGSIPASLGMMVDAKGESARLVYLHNNMLSGDVPASLGNLTSLVRLLLSGNMLTGCIPAAIEGAAEDADAAGLMACADDGS